MKLYQREIHDNLGFFATWLPGDPIGIGDVGVLEEGRFRRLSSLNELGIRYEVEDAESVQNIQYTSTQGTKLSASVGATAAMATTAEIAIDISSTGAFVFHAFGLRPRRLENRGAVGDQVVQAYRRRVWKQEWLLVEALHTAERATIIVSEDSSAGVVLVATANVPLLPVSLADPKVELTVSSTRGRIVHLVGRAGLRPLYSCIRLTDPLLRGPSVQPVRGSAGTDMDAAWTRPRVEELLNS